MSDTFNHEADAWDDYSMRFEAGDDDPSGYGGSYRSRRRYPLSPPNPLFYHTKVEFKRIVHTTHKAYCLEVEREADRTVFVWVPKKCCRKMESNSVWIWITAWAASYTRAYENSPVADFKEKPYES